MEKVTVEQCKAAIAAMGTTRVDHHRCAGCGYMTGYIFPKASEAYANAADAGFMDDDTVVGFDPGCDCSSYGPSAPRESSWEDFAEVFNMQTPEIRDKMWNRFIGGGATHEAD